jgi:hypothetical protein
MPQGDWQIVKKGQDGALYINPGNSSNSLVRASSSRPVHFNFQTARAKFQYKGPDNSSITERAIRIAEMMAGRA